MRVGSRLQEGLFREEGRRDSNFPRRVIRRRSLGGVSRESKIEEVDADH